MCKTTKQDWHTLIITHQGNLQVKDCKIHLLAQQYEKFSISNEETTNSDYTWFNAIVTSLKSLDKDYSNKNHVKSLALKAKVNREQTSDDSDSQGGSDEDEAKACNLMPKENKALVERAWRDSEDGDEPQNDVACLMAADSQE
nr:UBN2 domain-containing protein [Tanacetum cinerariifolium]